MTTVNGYLDGLTEVEKDILLTAICVNDDVDSILDAIEDSKLEYFPC